MYKFIPFRIIEGFDNMTNSDTSARYLKFKAEQRARAEIRTYLKGIRSKQILNTEKYYFAGLTCDLLYSRPKKYPIMDVYRAFLHVRKKWIARQVFKYLWDNIEKALAASQENDDLEINRTKLTPQAEYELNLQLAETGHVEFRKQFDRAFPSQASKKKIIRQLYRKHRNRFFHFRSGSTPAEGLAIQIWNEQRAQVEQIITLQGQSHNPTKKAA